MNTSTHPVLLEVAHVAILAVDAGSYEEIQK
jgi:hypothetical protein